MDIKHAKAILVIGLSGCNALKVIKDVTGTTPQQGDATSLAGLTHQWDVSTKYYSASIPIWVDEVADVHQWKTEFLRPEAKEVVEAIGAWLVCLTLQEKMEYDSEALLQAIQQVVEEHSGFSNDSIMLVVASSPAGGTVLAPHLRAAWEDKAIEHGFELLDYAGTGHNEYGEKEGMARAKEALLAHEWSMAPTDTVSDDMDELEDTAFADLTDPDGLTTSMKAALISDNDAEPVDDADQASGVDDLDAMLSKLLAAREKVADLPEAQRKKAAVNAVRQLMNDSL